MQLSRIASCATLSSLATAAVILAACGGGNDNTPDAPSFLARFNAGQMALAAPGNTATAAAADLLDDRYLDMGMRKPDVVAALANTSQAFASDPDLSLFPMGQVSNISVSACENDVCTLNGTLTNTDADATAVDFSTKVRVVGGAVLLYGDQSADAAG